MTAPPARFAMLYAAQFAAVGVMQPFLPPLLAARGLPAEAVAAMLTAGAAVRLLAGPLGGRAADGLGDARRLMAAAALLAAVAACGFGLVAELPALLVAMLLLSLGMAPVIPLTDALAIGAMRAGRGGFDYGRVRAAGSVSYILASAGAGLAAERLGLVDAVPWLLAAALIATAGMALQLPSAPDRPRASAETEQGDAPRRGGFATVLAITAFRRLLLLSALIQGSHALYYAFSSIHWAGLGLSKTVIGLLWAEGVVAEVALFVWGRGLADRLGPVGLTLLAAGAGVLRWAVTAETGWLPALAAVQLLHGATFGAQHLAAIRVLAQVVPQARAGTAQALHASLGTGLAAMLLTLASGPLYAAFGGTAFWAMAGLCALAVLFCLWRPPVSAA